MDSEGRRIIYEASEASSRLLMRNPEEENRSVLGEADVVDLLILLLEKGSIIATQLRLVNRNYAKIAAVARDLEDRGLVTIILERSPRVTHIYRLTPKGRRVAEKLREVKEIIGE